MHIPCRLQLRGKLSCGNEASRPLDKYPSNWYEAEQRQQPSSYSPSSLRQFSAQVAPSKFEVSPCHCFKIKLPANVNTLYGSKAVQNTSAQGTCYSMNKKCTSVFPSKCLAIRAVWCNIYEVQVHLQDPIIQASDMRSSYKSSPQVPGR